MRTNRPYVQLDPAVIEQARQMDLLSYLQRYEPNNLKSVAGCDLSAEECTASSEVLKSKNEIANLELKEVYFKDCIDCANYLKKLSILYPLWHWREADAAFT